MGGINQHLRRACHHHALGREAGSLQGEQSGSGLAGKLAGRMPMPGEGWAFSRHMPQETPEAVRGMWQMNWEEEEEGGGRGRMGSWPAFPPTFYSFHLDILASHHILPAF